MSQDGKFVSTSALAKSLDLPLGELRARLTEAGLVVRVDAEWKLTEAGEKAGGQYKESKHGPYIAWPPGIADSVVEKPEPGDTRSVSATKIGEAHGVSPQRTNQILSELGWIEKGLKGWVLTGQGKKIGGLQKEHPRTGIPYVMWPASILSNKTFVDNIKEIQGESATPSQEHDTTTEIGFRDKFEAKHRTTDGHYVRSKAEMLIDNWLYMAEIAHAYERKLPIEEEVYCDFYLPAGKLYIEYWGYDNDAKYSARKAAKQGIYAKYGFKLVELEDKDVQNLDDVLPRLLLKHGIQTY